MRWNHWKGREHAPSNRSEDGERRAERAWGDRSPARSILYLMAVMLGFGCSNNYFEITSDSDPDMSIRFTPSQTATVGAGPSFLGDIAGDMGQVRYRTDSEKRMFLLDSTLEGRRRRGLQRLLFPPARSFIRLPASDDVERELAIASLDPTKEWRSARLYDAGMCSALAPLDWPDDGPDIDGAVSLVGEIPKRITQELNETEGIVNAELKQWAVEPILRMVVDEDNPFDRESGILRRDADALKVFMRVEVDEIFREEGVIDAPCRNAQLDIDFTLVFEVANRVAVNNRQCLLQGFADEGVENIYDLECPECFFLAVGGCPQDNLADAGSQEVSVNVFPFYTGTAKLDENGKLCSSTSDECVQCFWVGDDPDIGSVRPRILGVEITLVAGNIFTTGRCGPLATKTIPGEIAKEIENRLPTEIEREISEALLHTSLEAATGCRADCDCVQVGSDGRLIPGARWECGGKDDEGVGTCRVVAEADRVHIRPDTTPAVQLALLLPSDTSDGTLEIVVAEDEDDIQAWFLPHVNFGPQQVGSGCDGDRHSWGADEDPQSLELNWPFKGGDEPTLTLASGGASGNGDPSDDPNGVSDPGSQGRGPGTAAPPGQGEGLDRGTDHSRGRGTGEAPAQGGNPEACEAMCLCLADEHDLDPGECFAQCTELTRGMSPSEQQSTCEAAFVEADAPDSECSLLCDGFGTPGGGGR
jgi:hypothetical protein